VGPWIDAIQPATLRALDTVALSATMRAVAGQPTTDSSQTVPRCASFM